MVKMQEKRVPSWNAGSEILGFLTPRSSGQNHSFLKVQMGILFSRGFARIGANLYTIRVT
jgi:hypothetical protein